jgi:hypothetical protein
MGTVLAIALAARFGLTHQPPREFLMRTLLAAIAALCIIPATHANQVALHRGAGGTLTLFDDRCALKMPHESFANRAALRLPSGQEFGGCFRVNGHWVELVYEDGDIGVLPAAIFTRPGNEKSERPQKPEGGLVL